MDPNFLGLSLFNFFFSRLLLLLRKVVVHNLLVSMFWFWAWLCWAVKPISGLQQFPSGRACGWRRRESEPELARVVVQTPFTWSCFASRQSYEEHVVFDTLIRFLGLENYRTSYSFERGCNNSRATTCQVIPLIHIQYCGSQGVGTLSNLLYLRFLFSLRISVIHNVSISWELMCEFKRAFRFPTDSWYTWSLENEAC